MRLHLQKAARTLFTHRLDRPFQTFFPGCLASCPSEHRGKNKKLAPTSHPRLTPPSQQLHPACLVERSKQSRLQAIRSSRNSKIRRNSMACPSKSRLTRSKVVVFQILRMMFGSSSFRARSISVHDHPSITSNILGLAAVLCVHVAPRRIHFFVYFKPRIQYHIHAMHYRCQTQAEPHIRCYSFLRAGRTMGSVSIQLILASLNEGIRISGLDPDTIKIAYIDSLQTKIITLAF